MMLPPDKMTTTTTTTTMSSSNTPDKHEQSLMDAMNLAVARHISKWINPTPEGMSRRMFHQAIADDIVLTLNMMGFDDAASWIIFKGDGKFNLAIRVEGLISIIEIEVNE